MNNEIANKNTVLEPTIAEIRDILEQSRKKVVS